MKARCARPRFLTGAAALVLWLGFSLPGAQALPPAATAAAFAQEGVIDSRERTARAVPLEGSIQIDGRLDEPGWQRAEPAVGFIQDEPFEGDAAMEPTEVRILYDDRNLYIGARLYDSNPARIARQLTRRDETGRAADYFEFSIDPNRDRLTGYRFRVTAAGVQWDSYLHSDTGSDGSWDAVWESEVHLDDQGWSVEIRIPLSQLRYEGGNGPQLWGVDFARRRIADNERSVWSWRPSGVHGNISRFGQLHGLEMIERGRHVEIQPYVMSSWRNAPATAGDPFFSGNAFRTRAGADIRYSLSSTFMADIALNPDFGQVEVDPQVINLGASENFYPERRAFFTRDDRIFDFSLSGGQNTLFHARRIGRNPQGRAPAGADFVSIPGETAILGAGKITGRTRGGLGVGVLAAVTDREHGRAYYLDEDEIVQFVAEPRAYYSVARLQQDFNDGATSVGGIVTVLDRDLPADGSLDFLTDQAYSGGVDFEHNWDDRAWQFTGFLAGSHVRGSEDALWRIQRSPNHYHQRPDQDYLTLDPNATSMSGAEWRLQLTRRAGQNWGGSVWLAQRSPGFEVNDLGFSGAIERLDGGARIQYRESVPSRWFQNYNFNVNTVHHARHSVFDDVWSASSWSDAHSMGRVNANANFTLRNWWNINFQYTYNLETQSQGLTRGGPLMTNPGSSEYRINLNTDRRNEISWSGSIGHDAGSYGNRRFLINGGLEARPNDWLNLSVNLSYDRRTDTRQYVTQVQDASYTPTYGGRYFFGDLEREQLSMNLRANVIFSPTLSLEVFAQPLIAAGDYVAYKQLAQARSFDFLRFTEGQATAVDGATLCTGGSLCRSGSQIHVDYTGNGVADMSFRDQNFNVRSLRGNAVLRWEYMPGSRLFLVWQHQRQERVALGDFQLSRDGRALFQGAGEHMFMVKIDRWFDFQ